jgi:hypothetical protein
LFNFFYTINNQVSEQDGSLKLFGVYPVPIPSFLITIVTWALRALLLYYTCVIAYDIRTFAIKEYGMIIHEFDPWFNYRATGRLVFQYFTIPDY